MLSIIRCLTLEKPSKTGIRIFRASEMNFLPYATIVPCKLEEIVINSVTVDTIGCPNLEISFKCLEENGALSKREIILSAVVTRKFLNKLVAFFAI